jgi:hypothetical protein
MSKLPIHVGRPDPPAAAKKGARSGGTGRFDATRRAPLRIAESKDLSSELCPIQALARIWNRSQVRINPRSEDASKFVAFGSRSAELRFGSPSWTSSSTQLENPAEIASKPESFASNSESKNGGSES